MSKPDAQLVADLFEAWNAHDADRIASLYAPDYEGVDIGEATPRRGHAGIRDAFARYLHAFPDVCFALDEIVAQGNRVALVWTATGTHQGSFMNIPPTGRTVAVRGMSLLEVEDGKVTRDLSVWDVAGLLRAIGLLPDLYANTGGSSM